MKRSIRAACVIVTLPFTVPLFCLGLMCGFTAMLLVSLLKGGEVAMAASMCAWNLITGRKSDGESFRDLLRMFREVRY